MDILNSLESFPFLQNYKILDYRKFDDGFYLKISALLSDSSQFFITEYSDAIERNYSYHWQEPNGEMIMRWDNAPHFKNIPTYPHHQHIANEVFPSKNTTVEEVLEIIAKHFGQNSL